MNTDPGLLQEQLDEYQTQLKGLKSYLRELNEVVSKNGTEKDQYETDVLEAENNVQYYEAEIEHIEQELKGAARPQSVRAAAVGMLPQTATQGAGTLLFSSLTFLAGLLIGSRLLSGRRGKESNS